MRLRPARFHNSSCACAHVMTTKDGECVPGAIVQESHAMNRSTTAKVEAMVGSSAKQVSQSSNTLLEDKCPSTNPPTKVGLVKYWTTPLNPIEDLYHASMNEATDKIVQRIMRRRKEKSEVLESSFASQELLAYKNSYLEGFQYGGNASDSFDAFAKDQKLRNRPTPVVASEQTRMVSSPWCTSA